MKELLTGKQEEKLGYFRMNCSTTGNRTIEEWKRGYTGERKEMRNNTVIYLEEEGSDTAVFMVTGRWFYIDAICEWLWKLCFMHLGNNNCCWSNIGISPDIGLEFC